jgi:stress-induced-phosphoprotein 1
MSTAAEFKNIGNGHLQKGEFDEAIAAYTKAIELNGSDHVFYSNRSAAYLSKGDAANALIDAEKCVEVKGDWPKGYSRKGAALHALKRYDDAAAAYQTGLAIAPSDAGLQSGLAEVQKAQAASAGGGFQFPPQLLAKLATHPKFGPKMKDPAFLQKLGMIQSNPALMMQDPEMMEILQLMIGDVAGEAGAGAAAPTPQPYTPAPAATSKPVPAPAAPLTPAQEAKNRGNVHYKAKEFQEALACYDEAIALEPENALFLNNKAAVYIELGEIDTALETCQRAIEIGRANRAPYEDIAKIYQRQAAAELKRNNIEAAMTHYRSAQMENFDKAVERKVKNLELDLKKQKKLEYINPELGLEAKERGNTAFREGNFPKAVSEYEEACKRDPTNAAYFNNYAAALLKLGDFNGAKTQVTKSLELDKTYVKAWAKKGDIEFFMKEYHKAMDSYRAGLQLDPESTLCKDGLAKVTMQVNAMSSEEDQKERAAHAMADPEIQSILQDPVIRNVLQNMQDDPSSGARAMADPVVKAKLEKLIASGVLQVR